MAHHSIRSQGVHHGPQLDKARLMAFRIWALIGGVIVLLGLGKALGMLGQTIEILAVAAVITFLCNPIVDFLDERRVPRVLGTLIAYLVLLALISLVVLLIAPVVIDQLTSLIGNIPGYVDQSQEALTSFYANYSHILSENPQLQAQLQEYASKLGQIMMKFANAAGASLVGFGGAVISAIATVGMALVVAFWIAMDLPKMRREIMVLVGPRRAESFEIITSVCYRAIGGYLKGLIITSAITGCLAAIGFKLVGLPYAGLLGLITGLLNVIPIVGPWVGGAIAGAVGLFVAPLTGLLAVVVTIVAQQITDTFVSPKVMQSSVAVHPMLVILGLTAGGALGGIVGMILAVPALAAAKGVFVYYFESTTGRQLVSEEGAFFVGKAFNDDEGRPIPALDATGGSKYYAGDYAQAHRSHAQDARFSFSRDNIDAQHEQAAEQRREEQEKQERKEAGEETLKDHLEEGVEAVKRMAGIDEKTPSQSADASQEMSRSYVASSESTD